MTSSARHRRLSALIRLRREEEVLIRIAGRRLATEKIVARRTHRLPYGRYHLCGRHCGYTRLRGPVAGPAWRGSDQCAASCGRHLSVLVFDDFSLPLSAV